MADLAAAPVTEAVYTVLQDTTLLATLTGGVHEDVPQDPTYPFAWVELFGEADQRGFGTGGLPEIDMRVHVFSHYAGKQEAQSAIRQIIALLKDVALTVTGWTMCGHVFYDETLALADEELHGVKVHEFVAMFRVFVEE